MNSKNNRRWGLRLTAGLGVAALGVMAFGAPALAADPEFGNIDTDLPGSITLHKHEHQSGATQIAGDPLGGTELPNPIGGVIFTAYPLTDFDVESADDWDALADLDLADAACPVPNSDPLAPSASVDGWTVGAGLPFGATGAADGATPALSVPLGAYLICETSAPADVVDHALPFVITVPFPDNQTADRATAGWIYNVHAYPKNGKAVTVAKSVDEQGELGLGAEVSFPVTTGVPRIADDAQFTQYTVVDPLDPRLGSTAVESVTLDGAALTEGVEYEVVVDRNVLMVQFTQAGLELLKLNGGKDVVTVFTGTVESLDAVDGTGLAAGEIFNQAYLVTDNERGLPEPPTDPNLPPLNPTDPVDPEDPDGPKKPIDPTDPNGPFNPGDPEDPDNPYVPPIESNEVTQNWGDVQVLKYDQGSGSAKTGLAGAVFEIYPAKVAYLDPAGDPAVTECTIEMEDGAEAIEVGGETTFASDEDGLLSIAGLFVSDSENDPKNAAERCYVLVEVQAPAGYVTPSGDAAKTAVTVVTGKTDISIAYDAEIANAKNEMPELPLTGAQGQLLLMILGAGLVLAGTAVALVVARRRKAAEHTLS